MITKQTGAVLIVVLVLSAVLSSLLIVAFETGIIQTKMADNQLKEYKNRLLAEKLVREKEALVIQEPEPDDTNQLSFIQFVPDTLQFGEKEGAKFYKIEVESSDYGANVCLQTTFSVRNVF